MSIFQNSVVNKYLRNLDKEKTRSDYAVFKRHFHDPEIQENIRNSKEEQYQGEFLIDLFVNVLGYTKNPTPNFNLTTEYKNVKDSKKADGAILINGAVKAVIELKGTNTTDLGKIEAQAFGYKNNQPECVYIITSNFEKLRFYIDNAIEHIEFNLFTLSEKEFEMLYVCLAYENMAAGIPKKIKDESVSQEDVITKKLYKDYSLFKRELYHDLTQLNPQFEPLELFQKSQKLLDRFLFLFFAEDRFLLPPNSVRLILSDWKDLQERDVDIPLYDRFKKYFEYLNTGYKGKRYDVFAYNGGLFKADAVLDTIKIDDELLYKHALKLSEYDFASEVDVNILGHIFENSLNELDEIKAQLDGQEIDKAKTKRKKDGVFYTPKYITKYIVDNTVGKLCEEKKAELQLNEADYSADKKRHKTTRKALDDKLTAYRNWLLQLTICDPACGSGAFLNQALDFLITEHRYIDELQAKLSGFTLVLSDVEKSILENNLFGVDLNEESVEIAKLSLWLRTARPNRKLNDLNNNLKCGNSLIDDPTVAGEKAFNWQQEFPQVFQIKEKKAFHITTATHDSRTSDRMIIYKVREKRDNGLRPQAQPIWLEPEDELLITQTIADIVKADNLNVLAYNICGDHLHVLLVCEEEEVPKIMQKIKAKTSRAVNISKGITREPAPLPQPAPLLAKQERGQKQNSLWTQKFGSKEITSPDQLWNTIAYIQNNRQKHGLPDLQPDSNDSNNKNSSSTNDNKGVFSDNKGAFSDNKGAFSDNKGAFSDNKGAGSLVRIIERMCCSYDHAFRTEYKGGFDVIIGNPPYVNINKMPEIHNYLKEVYSEIHTGYNDLMYYFLYKGISLLKESGVYGVITSNYFIGNDYADKLRLFLNKHIEQIVNFEKTLIFPDANVHTTLLFAKKNPHNPVILFYSYFGKETLKTIELNEDYSFCELNRANQGDKWIIANNKNQEVIDKLHTDSLLLGQICEIAKGSESGKNEIFTIKKETAQFYNIEKSILRKCIKNSNISRYAIREDDAFLIYTDNYFTEELYPNTFKYLEEHKPTLLDRRGPKNNEYEWWRLHRPSIKECFEANEKLVVPYRATKNRFAFDNQQLFNDGGDIRVIVLKQNVNFSAKFILTLLNSKLLDWYYGFIGKSKGDSREYFNKPLSEIPIKILSLNQQKDFELMADQMLSLNHELQEVSQKFQRTIQRKFGLTELPKKLQDWYQLSYAEFIKELAKKKVKLSLTEEAEWEDYFVQEAQKANQLKTQIETTDKQIDQMVYQLYNLTPDEIKIVESV